MKIEGGLIIHLARAVDRKPHVEGLLRGLPLPVEALDAVDGKAAAPADLMAYDPGLGLSPRFPFLLLPTEVACFLSHRAAWAQIVARGWEAGVVIEDDAGVEPARFAQALTMAAEAPGDGLIQLQSRDPGPGNALIDGAELRLSQPPLAPLRATCNVYSRAACERLLEVTERFDRPVDVLLQMHWVTGIRPLVIWPSGVTEASAQVGGTTIQKKDRGVLDRLNREVRRPLFRAAMKRWARRE